MRRYLIGAGAVLAGAALVGLLVWAIMGASREQAAWERWCREQGGSVTDSTATSVGVGVDPSTGKPVTVVSSSTTYYCLRDGGILDIR
jgi:hypothetical protein